MIKALVLLSGGLDSLLVYKILERAGILVQGVQFINPITTRDPGEVGEIFKKNNLTYVQRSNFSEFLEILKKPKYGYGRYLNPCIDCRLLNIHLAVNLMPEFGADFIATGEVLGQRPKSQLKRSMTIIEEESGIKGLLLRPLSAKLLPITIPEERGWVNREHMFDIQGRNRERQFHLAEEFGIEEFSTPGGGCPLTAKEYSEKVKDLIKAGDFNAFNLELLNTGRHFRLNNKVKLIVGRNHEENLILLEYSKKIPCAVIDEFSVKGPVSILVGDYNSGDIETGMKITSAYTKESGSLVMKWYTGKESRDLVTTVKITPFSREELNRYRID